MTYAVTPGWEMNFLGNMAINKYKFTPHSRETSFGTIQNMKKLQVVFDGGQERDRFETFFGAFTLKHKPAEHVEVGLQASAFTSKEEEGYDISGEYLLRDDESDSGDEAFREAVSGRYHEHARNRLRSNIANVGHYGMARIRNHTLKWGAQAQFEKIADRIDLSLIPFAGELLYYNPTVGN